MQKSEIDAAVYKAIKAIDIAQNPLIKARIQTVVDFLNGEGKILLHFF